MNIDFLHHDQRHLHETQLVRTLMKILGLEQDLAKIRSSLEQLEGRTGGERLYSFPAFRKVLPGFPIVLALEDVSNGRGATMRQMLDLLLDFDHSRLGECYDAQCEALADEAQGRPIGLVFRYGGRRGGYVIHNGQFETVRPWAIIRRRGGPDLRVEPLLNVLKFIRALPGDLDGEPGVSMTPAASTGSSAQPCPGLDLQRPVPARIKRLAGHGCSVEILDLIDNLLTSRLEGRQVEWIECREGVRWARLPEAGIATLLERPLRTVKYGVKQLVARGLLIRERTARGNLYRLSPAACDDPEAR